MLFSVVPAHGEEGLDLKLLGSYLTGVYDEGAAEIVAYDDLMAAGSNVAAKSVGKVRLEGKEYVVKDGDIIVVRFNLNK